MRGGGARLQAVEPQVEHAGPGVLADRSAQRTCPRAGIAGDAAGNPSENQPQRIAPDQYLCTGILMNQSAHFPTEASLDLTPSVTLVEIVAG